MRISSIDCKQWSNVWHSGLREQNKSDLKKIQKVALSKCTDGVGVRNIRRNNEWTINNIWKKMLN